MNNDFLCQPDDNHWCIECCWKTCPLLGDIGGGRRGCLGHNGKEVYFSPGKSPITQSPNCQEVDCLINKSQSEKEEMRRIIKILPPGEFKMSEVLEIHQGKFLKEIPRYSGDVFERIIAGIGRYLSDQWKIVDIYLSGEEQREMSNNPTPENRAKLYLYFHNKLRKAWFTAVIGTIGPLFEELLPIDIGFPQDLKEEYSSLYREVATREWMNEELVKKAETLMIRTRNFLLRKFPGD